LPLCPGDPFLDSSQTHAELLSDNPRRLSTMNSRDQLPPPRTEVFCSWYSRGERDLSMSIVTTID
jgi:hypothetical protein